MEDGDTFRGYRELWLLLRSQQQRTEVVALNRRLL